MLKKILSNPAVKAALITAKTVRLNQHQINAKQLKQWERVNFHGRTVNLAGGVKLARNLLQNTTPLIQDFNSIGGAIPIAFAGLAGYIDDTQGQLRATKVGEKPCAFTEKANKWLCTDTKVKGLKGHLGALKRGQVTTGALKIAGIGLGAFIGGGIIAGYSFKSKSRFLFEWAQNTVLIAGNANLYNLFDLRPGRALKIGLGTSAVLALISSKARSQALVSLIVSAIALPADLEEKEMLGDTGANALGASLGVAMAKATGPKGKLAINTMIVGLTLLSEKVSFSKVIESNPLLNKIDQLGRRP